MILSDALNRTLLLMRDHLDTKVPDAVLIDALTSVQIVFVGDRGNLRTPEGQTALVVAAILCARSGARCHLVIPNVPISGPQPPLEGRDLATALFELGTDLLPGGMFYEGAPDQADLAVVIGDSNWRGRAAQTWHLSGARWAGSIAPQGARWSAQGSPFGASVAGVLVGGEAFKTAMRRLRNWAADMLLFDQYFGPTGRAELSLAPLATPTLAPRVETLDFIGGGAITHAALFALARVLDLSATARVIEPGIADPPDLNRYMLLRRSEVDVPKVDSLASMDLGGLKVSPVRTRFDDETARTLGPLAADVLVGVDDIPSRWAVQRARPGWLGVGASTHYSTQISFHSPGLPCAICLHPHDDTALGPAPTAAFVSFWAGIWLASRFVRHAAGESLRADHQQVYSTMLRPDLPGAVWVSPVHSRPDCSLRCPL